MEYTEEFLKKITQCGTLCYPLSKIINVVDIKDEIQFIKDFDNPKSNISKAFQKGMDKADFILDSKLFEMASGGDLKAMEKYEARKKNQIKESEKELKDRQFHTRHTKFNSNAIKHEN